MTSIQRRRGPNRARTVASALAAALIGALAFASPAAAADPKPGNLPPGPYTIDVHKLEQPVGGSGLGNDGTEQDTSSLKPLQGVKYTVQQVQGVDLTTNAGWETVPTLTVSDGKVSDGSKDYALGAATEKTTDSTGTASFDGLAAGVYLVTEKDASGATDPATGKPVHVTQFSTPFLVTVPYPVANAGACNEQIPVVREVALESVRVSTASARTAAGATTASVRTAAAAAGAPTVRPVADEEGCGAGSWLTTVNAYPKNSVSSIEKSVDDSSTDYDAVQLGDEVLWTIRAKVPTIAEGQDLTDFAVTDKLDSRLEYVSATVTLTDQSGADVALEDSDYTVTAPAEDNASTLTVSFTQSGLAKLKENQTGTVIIELVTKVKSVGDGTIPNTATEWVNNPERDDTAIGKIPSNTVQSVWGWLKVHKFAHISNASLAGAEFTVYRTAEDAKKGENAVSTITTDTEGKAKIALKAGENGETDGITYYLVETKAPVGYQVNPDYSPDTPGQVTVYTGKEEEAYTEEVANTQVPPIQLPLTGSTGTALFIAGGVGLLVIAVGVALIAGRRGTRKGTARQ